jgi:mannose-6-phosphate isomerase-like protein (cupin superfamily)
MQKTSFGTIDILLRNGKMPVIEHLVFESEGRSHIHPFYETFVVLKGEGFVYRDDEKIAVSPNSMVTIGPKQKHWMEPTSETLEGFIWYHDDKLQ